MPTEPSYDAFLSYSHTDSRIAGRLHRYIQGYRLPDHKPLKVYRDATDIRSGDLSGEITRALRDSGSLLVCCSSSTSDSIWVRKEVEVFGELGGDRAIIPIVVEGEPEKVLPPTLIEYESRYLDLRGRWWRGFLSPAARVELARGIATIAQIPLRELIDWEKRRQRLFAAWTAALGLLVLTAVLFFPLDYQRPLDLAGRLQRFETLEFAEVREDGTLTVMVREIMEGPQGERNYVGYYPNVLENEERNWLDDGNFLPRTRLLHAHFLPYMPDRNLGKGFNIREMFAQARRAARESAADFIEEGDLEFDKLDDPQGPWIGEPSPGLQVALVTIPSVSGDPADEAYVSPPVGDAIVAVHRAGTTPQVVRVQGLEPVLKDLPGGLRSFNLNDGIPVAAVGDDVWIGLPVRENGAVGGLWHTADGGKTWQRIDQFPSVASIAVSPEQAHRVLVATAPGRIRSGIREARFEAQCWELPPGGSTWRKLDPAPPFSSGSRIHIAGFLPGGSCIILVDSVIHELGRDNLARRVLGR